MIDTEAVEEQLATARTLAREFAKLSEAQAATAMPVAGAATRALKWVGDAMAASLEKAAADDCDGFLAGFEEVQRRVRALEPVAMQLRPRWAAVADADEKEGDPAGSGHVRLYFWCREAVLAAWSAASPKKLRAAMTVTPGRLPEFELAPIRAHWASIRAVLAAIEPRTPEQFQTAVDGELAALTKAIPRPTVNKAAPSRIPREHISRPIGKAEAAKLHSGSSVADPAAYFAELVARELMTPPIVSGRALQFDVRDFPASKRDQLRG